MSGHKIPRVCLPANSAQGPARIPDLTQSASAVRPSPGGDSPIEDAFEGLRSVTSMAVEISKSGWRRDYGLILSSATVAVAEDYVRSVLVRLGQVCPIARERVATLDTSMAHVYSGSIEDALRASLDAVSFSDQAAVRDWTKKIAGVSIEKTGELASCLAEFHRASHIRHCATHAGGYVAARNAAVLGLAAGSWITFPSQNSIHSLVAVIAAFIRAYNTRLFEETTSRILDQGLLKGNWSSDKEVFGPIWRAFKCAPDIQAGRARGLGNYPTIPYRAFLGMRRQVLARSGA